MNIQELHGWPQPRERTSHMIGRSLGETLQGASNLYLQNKIQGYFDQQKEQRQLAADAQQRRQTAQAYENLTGIKGLAQKLEGMPIQFQEKALSEYGGGNQMLPWNQPVTAPSGTNPPINPPVNVPTAQKITGDIATAQRMGLTGEGGEGQEEGLEGTSGLPLGIGMPTPRGKALQGQAPQYQEAPIPQTPSGTIPPKPISGYPLADMSNEDFLQYLNTIPSQSRRKEVYQAREKEKSAQRAERTLNAVEQKAQLGRERFEWEKSEAEKKKNREEEQKNVNEFISNSQKRMQELPYQENLLSVAENSLSSKNFGLLSPDNLANYTHIEAFRSPEGEAFRTAIKDFFLSDMRALGAKQNMFIEKMMSSILPSVGKTQEANMSWVEMQRMKIALDKEKQRLIEEATPSHLDQYGNPKASLINDVNKKMMDFSNKMQDRTAYHLKEITEMNKSIDDLKDLSKVSSGTPLTAKRAKAFVEMTNGDIDKAIQVAKKLNYKIPDREMINE